MIHKSFLTADRLRCFITLYICKLLLQYNSLFLRKVCKAKLLINKIIFTIKNIISKQYNLR